MKIEKIRIRNFRGFMDETIEVGSYSAFVGANGAGKSTVLAALNVFFRNEQDTITSSNNLDAEDFHKGNTDANVEITVTFGDLCPDATTEFQDYVRHGQLSITASAEYNLDTGIAPVKQSGERLIFSEFKKYFEAEKAKVAVGELKEIYSTLRGEFTELPEAKTKDAMRTALREYEEARPESCKLERSDDNFYGFTKGSDRLRRFVNWVYIPAVKDATKENIEAKNTALGELVSITVRSKMNFDEQIEQIRDEARQKYMTVLGDQQQALDEVSEALTSRLGKLMHPNAKAELRWVEDVGKSVSVADPSAKLFAAEGDFSGDIARFGHGFQRCYLLALLQELASIELKNSPTLILGFEEPELYQHPPQARHLASILKELSEGNVQLLLTTHSPYFVSGQQFEDVYSVRRSAMDQVSTVTSVTFQEAAEGIAKAKGDQDPLPPNAQGARLHQALNPMVNEMFFCSRIILVEGIEDVAYLTSWLLLRGDWDAVRAAGAHLIPVSGKSNLTRPIVISRLLKLPVYVMFDSDGHEQNPRKREAHAKDNTAILRALGMGIDTFPDEDVFSDNYVQWVEEFGTSVKSDVEQRTWDRAFGVARKSLGSPTGDFSKNPLLIGELLSNLYSSGVEIQSLDLACDGIMKFLEEN